MAKGISSLGDIIVSIAKAVAQAQSDVEESQLSHIFTFFERKFEKDENGEYTDELLKGNFPKNFTIGIPDSDDEYYRTKYYNVPYLAMLPITPIHIDTLKTEFDIGLVGLAAEGGEKGDNMTGFDNLPSLQIDVLGGGLKEKGLSAHVSLTMCKHELPEGTARMINELINRCQKYEKEQVLKKADK